MAAMETEPMRKRRWFRYRLRTLLVLITAVAIGLGWVTKERRESQSQIRIAEILRANGAGVEFVGQFDDESTAEQSCWRASLSSLLGPRVLGVYMEQSRLDDFAPLAGLQDLRILQVWNSSV